MQGLGLAFAVLWHLRHGARPPPHDLPAHIVSNAAAAVFAMLAALAADEALTRRVRFWCAYPIALLAASALAAIVQWCLQCWPAVALSEWGSPSVVAMTVGLDVFMLGGLGMLAYINRQSTERMLQGVRAAELDRLRVERCLIESRLAATQARIDPDAVLRHIAGIRSLYADARPEADQGLEALIQELRARLAQGAGVTRPQQGAP